jgi:outer membrane cobalamin receptor
MYVDGVYIPRTSGYNSDLTDIDHIEVLEGPQGTLFGKNTIGGVVNIITLLDSGFMSPEISARMPGAAIVGTAVTVRVTVPDSVMAHYALGQIRAHDILVIERGQASVRPVGAGQLQRPRPRQA